MKMIIALAALVAVVSAAPQRGIDTFDASQPSFFQNPLTFFNTAPSYDKEVEKITIVSEEPHNNNGHSPYRFSYQLSNGQFHREVAEAVLFRDPKTDKDFTVYRVKGSFGYPDGNGNIITVNYVADENGFRPEGEHLPKNYRKGK
ncbi:endocuticle structural glycoprotein SgAbd-3 [Copidosoma floridanum]|uniref:endocuticle structural glycoprotein SgAbd-3 n=1 Tax=Copidosoma floridanum TaxID=29053 RepID=UPI0006C95E78|nr:endocuticle structural glycoprotein SgAbd-3 [Copidosoma floridanum]